MNFLDRIFNFLDQADLPKTKKWIAENQSWDSAPTDQATSWLPVYHGAEEALEVLFLCLFQDPWKSWEVIQRIAESAYFQDYSGRWKQVQDILEQVTTSEDIKKFVELAFSEDDFFGNFLRNCEKLLRKNPHSYRLLERDRRKPRRLIRRRGYQDKGSLRPTTLRGSFPPDPQEKEDRRRKIHFQHIPDF